MISPKDIAELDAACKALVDTMPVMLWGLYNGLLKEGFKEEQALRLTIEFVRNFGPRQQ